MASSTECTCNGIETGPKSYIVREPEPGSSPDRQTPPTPYADYPHPDASPVNLYLLSGERRTGGLSTVASAGQGREELTDDVAFDAPSLAQAVESANRLIYATPELTESVHRSGTAQIAIRLASSAPAANLSVYLVQLPWTPGRIGPANLITRGWANPQNAASLKSGGDYSSMAPGKPLRPGEFVTLTFDLQPDDQIVPAGKRIALMILSSDRDFTLWPKPGPVLTVDLDQTRLRLPVVGGSDARARSIGSDRRNRSAAGSSLHGVGSQDLKKSNSETPIP
jgi:X-Pro dipeptidyl-peptidase